MSGINLLYQDKKKETRPAFIKENLLLIGMIILCCVALYYLHLQKHQLILAHEVNDQRLQRVQIEINQVAESLEDVSLLEAKWEECQSLAKHKTSWNQCLDELTNAVPENNWIARIEIHGDSYLLLEGYTTSVDALSAMKGILDGKPCYSNVRLSALYEERFGAESLLYYHIVCGLDITSKN